MPDDDELVAPSEEATTTDDQIDDAEAERALVLEAMGMQAGETTSTVATTTSEPKLGADHADDAPPDDETETEPAAAADKAPADAEPEDPWATAPEPLREAHQRALAAMQAERDRERGRTSALTKKLNKLSSREETPETAAERTDLEAKLTALKDDYPEIGEALDAALKLMRNEVQPIRAGLDEVAGEADDAEQTAILVEAEPNFYPTMAKIGAETFKEWADAQPTWVKRIVDENWATCVDGDAVASVFQRFKKQHPDLVSAGDPPPQTAAATAAPRTRPQDSRRDRQLAGAATPAPGGRTAVPAPAPVSENEIALQALEWANRTFHTS